MPGDTTIVFGVPVPSVDPVFLAVVRFHILVGIACVGAGIAAMLTTLLRAPQVTNAILQPLQRAPAGRPTQPFPVQLHQEPRKAIQVTSKAISKNNTLDHF